MTSVSCGGWNRTNIRAFRASRPTVRRPRSSCSLVPGVGIEPTDSWFKARHHYQQRRPRNVIRFKSALRESNPPRQLGRLEPLPLGQGHKRKEWSRTPRLIARLFSRQLPSPIGLPFHQLRRQESNLRRAINSRLPYQHRTHRISVRTAGFEPAISCSRSRRNARLSYVLKMRPAGIEPTHPAWQAGRLPLHHGRKAMRTKLSKNIRAPGRTRTGVAAVRERSLRR